MKTVRSRLAAALVALAFAIPLAGCAATTHPVVPASLGAPRPSAAFEGVVDEPGPITVETVISADWEVDRSGLINLDHPTAKAAHLVDGREPIQIIFHAMKHPTAGLFLVDSGVERAFVEKPDDALIRGMIGSFAHLDQLKVRVDTASFVARQDQPVRGVFLTHLHLDHVMGLRDVPSSAKVYVGPGDAEETAFMNLLMSGIYDRALEHKGPLREVRFTGAASAPFDGLLDVFGDETFWAIWVPGHTPGSIAYVARTPNGPVLLTGDVCHTVWGWKNGVEPGTFSEDRARGAESLAKLEALVARHPKMDVRLGHQTLARP